MKRLLVALSIAILSGCAVVFPIPHDGAAFNNLVEVKIAVDKLNCTDKNWSDAFSKIEKLKVYTTLRNDPQASAVDSLEIALKKAQESKNEKFCESVVKINKARVDVIADAWRGRK
jgi:uncharacterized protein YceK